MFNSKLQLILDRIKIGFVIGIELFLTLAHGGNRTGTAEESGIFKDHNFIHKVLYPLKLRFYPHKRRREQCTRVYRPFKLEYLHVRPDLAAANLVMRFAQRFKVFRRPFNVRFAYTDFILVRNYIHIQTRKLIQIGVVRLYPESAVRSDQRLLPRSQAVRHL